MSLSSRGINRASSAPMALEPPVNTHELRDWLRSLKDASGMSYKAIAQAVGEDPRNVTRWMSTKNPTVPAGDAMLRLLSCLGVTMEPPEPETVKATNARIDELKTIVARIDRALEILRAEGLEEAAGSSDQLRVAVHLQSLEEAVDRQRELVEYSLVAVEARLGRIDERLGLPGQPENEASL